MKYLSIILIGILILTSACGEDCTTCDPLFTNNQIEFTNLGEAQEQLFRLDSIIVIGQPGDTIVSSYFLKEEISNNISNERDNPRYQITRSLSVDNGNAFTVVAEDEYEIINTDVLRSYGNVRFNVLNIPARESKMWNGGKFLSSDNVAINIAGEPLEFFKENWPAVFEYSNFAITEEIAGIEYDSVITITQANNDRINEIRFSIEKYAWNVGLVYREMQIFDELCNQSTDICRDDLPWPVRADRGFMLKQWRVQ